MRWKYSLGFGSFIITLILFLTILLPLFTKQEPLSSSNPIMGYNGGTSLASLSQRYNAIRAKSTVGNGIVNSISVRLVMTSGFQVTTCQGAIYTYTDNTSAFAGGLLAVTENKSINITTTGTWFVFNFTGVNKITITNNTWYYLVFRDPTLNTNQRMYYASLGGIGAWCWFRSSMTTGFESNNPMGSETVSNNTKYSIYCTYTRSPVVSSIAPANGSTGVHIQPRCNVTVADIDADTLRVTFASNKTGSWVNYQTNTTSNGTVRWASIFDGYATKYWWKYYVSDGYYNISSWQYFTTEDAPESREWTQLLSGWFRFSNLTAWKQRQTGWFLFRNLTQWEQRLSGYFRFSNQTVFKQEQSGWFNFRNLTGWKQRQSGWFRFGNQTGFKQLVSGFFRFSNQTGFKQRTAGWFRFSNNTVFKQEASGWFRFSNLSLDTWKSVEQGWFRFSNNTGFKKEASGWFRFSNSTGYKQKVSGWFRFSNLSVGLVILSVYPANHSTGVLRNVTYHVTVADSTGHSMNITWKRDNGTVYLGSSIEVYNGTYFMFSNASLANHLYNWSVNITDGTTWLNQSQWYRTGTETSGGGLLMIGRPTNNDLILGLSGGILIAVPLGLILFRRRKKDV